MLLYITYSRYKYVFSRDVLSYEFLSAEQRDVDTKNARPGGIAGEVASHDLFRKLPHRQFLPVLQF